MQWEGIKEMDVSNRPLFARRDRVVDEYCGSGEQISCEQILERISNQDFWDECEVVQACENSLAELERRERWADVHLSDYLRRNYRGGVALFYSPNHPRTSVLFEYACRILCHLGFERLPDMSEEDQTILFDTLKGQDIPIYPTVIRALKLKEVCPRYFVDRYLCGYKLLDFKEYYRAYMSYWWGVEDEV